jgi:hypothetical protein
MNEKEKKEAKQKALINLVIVIFKIYFPKVLNSLSKKKKV